MKVNKIEHKRHWTRLITALVSVVVLGVGAVIAADKLHDIYLEQCILDNPSAQVTIACGKMVKANIIAENLGLCKGANLATINFAKKREELLAQIPNLRSVRITRRLPNKINVVTEERIPVARIIVKGNRNDIGRVVDTEGVVFFWLRDTQGLPVIREAQQTPKGRCISGRARAALRLIEACSEPELIELNVLEVDTLKRDFLTATLGNYSRVKILWENMDGDDSRDDLMPRLRNLRDAIRSNVAPRGVIWNATIPNRIFADTQEKF